MPLATWTSGAGARFGLNRWLIRMCKKYQVDAVVLRKLDDDRQKIADHQE